LRDKKKVADLWPPHCLFSLVVFVCRRAILELGPFRPNRQQARHSPARFIHPYFPFADRLLARAEFLRHLSEYPISKNYLDARVQSIYAGTNEIMKEVIERGMRSAQEGAFHSGGQIAGESNSR